MSSKTKQNKRKEKRSKRRDLHKQGEITRWENGVLIKENANGGMYSKEYTIALTNRLIGIINSELTDSHCLQNPKIFYQKFLCIKNYIRDLLVYWSGDVGKTFNYHFLRVCYETYLNSKTCDIPIDEIFMGLIIDNIDKVRNNYYESN